MVETMWWTFKEVYLELYKSNLDGLNEMEGKESLILRLEDFGGGFRDINIPASASFASSMEEQ